MKLAETLICYVVYVLVAVVVGLAATLSQLQGVAPPSVLPNTTCNASDVAWTACGPHGVCMVGLDARAACVCAAGYVHGLTGRVPPGWNGTCAYPQVSNVNAFLASFLGGAYGADWFLLSRGGGGNTAYIAAGVFKIVTLGGCGVWWLVDWVRVLTNSFPDAYGYPLFDEMNTGHKGTLPA